MSDNRCRIILMFFQKLLCPRKSNLIDILLHFITRHTDTPVRNRQRTCLFVSLHPNFHLPQLSGILTRRSQHFQFLRGIHRIRHNFTQENIMIGIKKFFDNRKQILCRNTNFTCCHITCIFTFLITFFIQRLFHGNCCAKT